MNELDRVGLSALIIGVLALALTLIFFFLSWFNVKGDTVCSLIEELPDPEVAPDTLLFAGKELEKCVVQEFPYESFLSNFLLKTCTYRAPDRYTELNLSEPTMPMKWIMRSVVINGVDMLPHDEPSPIYNTPGDLGTVGNNNLPIPYITFLNNVFTKYKLDELFGFVAAEEKADMKTAGGSDWEAAYRITSNFGINWSFTVDYVFIGPPESTNTYTYTSDPLNHTLVDGTPGMMVAYYGNCQVSELPGFVLPEGLARTLEERNTSLRADAAKGLSRKAATPLESTSRLLDWSESSNLLKTRVQTIKKALCDEMKLEASSVHLWLFGSQLRGNSRSRLPDIDLKVFHPSFATRLPSAEEIRRVHEQLDFAVDLNFLRKPLDQPFFKIPNA